MHLDHGTVAALLELDGADERAARRLYAALGVRVDARPENLESRG